MPCVCVNHSKHFNNDQFVDRGNYTEEEEEEELMSVLESF